MEEWKEYKASEFCESVTDGTHDSPKSKDKGFYLITSKHLKDSYIDFASAKFISREDYQKVIQRSKVEQYDVLFSMIGTIGNTLRVTSPKIEFAVKNMGIFKFGGNNLNSKWFYYWLKSPKAKEYIKSRLSGSTQSYLTLNSLRDFPVLCPDNKTKKDVISILSSLDDKIELNRRINENLEQQAQALFKSWFVDFEPFKDGKFVDSELGMIPEGWKVGNLEELVEVKYGKDHKKLASGDIPVYGSGGIMRYADKSLYDKESVLIPRKGSLNNVMYVNHPFWTVDTMFYTCMKIEGIAKFIYLLISPKDLLSMNSGSAVPSMTVDILNKIVITIPTTTILQKFESIVKPIFIMMESCSTENKKLAQLRDTLLPRLMSGELTITDVDDRSIFQ